jgi:hypothetical protein
MWYRTLKAAQYLRVAPWELAAQPAFWLNASEIAQQVEDEDRKAREAKQARLGKAAG